MDDAQAAAQWVLREYRKQRAYNSSPWQTMHNVRDLLAGTICMEVARGEMPPVHLIGQWQAASSYLQSMHARPTYWWRSW